MMRFLIQTHESIDKAHLIACLNSLSNICGHELFSFNEHFGNENENDGLHYHTLREFKSFY